jgi:hypothetical protein
MANIQPSLKGWSTTEASNQPDSTDSATIAGDLRAIQAAIRQYFAQDTIASAATTDLGSKEAGTLTISGTTTITALGTLSAGIRKKVVFSGSLTLTHNATSLILPSAANITTAAGDRAEFESLGSGNWRCNWYQKADGSPVSLASPPAIGGGTPAAITGTTVTGADTTDATSSTAGAMKTAGGLAVAKKLFVGTLLDLSTGTAGQIKFPATQNASADANTLDDYEEGTFTPTISFVTPGNLTVVYSTQVGEYTKIGRDVRVSCNLITSTFTHSTASGNLLINGYPFTAASLSGQVSFGGASWQGITKANYTQMTPALSQGASQGTLQASGSGQGIQNIATGDMPTGGTVRIQFTMNYPAA